MLRKRLAYSALLLMLELSWIEAFSTIPQTSVNQLGRHVLLSKKVREGECSKPVSFENINKKHLMFEHSLDNPKWFRTSAFLLAAALPLILHVNGVLAFDHPVDYLHLNIPNPIPDADPRYFFSGALCAAASHGVTTPIDVVKTRMQAQPEVFNEGLFRATSSIIQKDGANSLLAGLGPTVIGYGLEGGMKFGLYESLKPLFARLLDVESTALPYLGASIVAGSVASLLLCPMERTRIKLVTDPDFASGLLSGFPRLVKEEGVLNLFRGFPAMLSKQVPYTFSKQVSFDIFAGMLYTLAANSNFAASDVKYEVSLGAAFLASILSCISSHPGDVLLTATYKGNSKDGFGEVIADIYAERGFSGFFIGITARFLHVGTIITSQLVLYDIVKQMLGLPATGAH